MVRIKATGEAVEVDRTVMQVLRSEEKRLRRALSSESEPCGTGKTAPTPLSLDALPEDVADSCWLLDARAVEIEGRHLDFSLGVARNRPVHESDGAQGVGGHAAHPGGKWPGLAAKSRVVGNSHIGARLGHNHSLVLQLCGQVRQNLPRL